MPTTRNSTLIDARRSKADLQREIAELRQILDERAQERDEALQRETATAEVLQVINSSPADLTLVFEAILERAMRLCGASFGILRTYDGQHFYTIAAHGVPPRFAKFLASNPQDPQPGTMGFHFLQTRMVVHVADAMDHEGYRSGDV